MKKKKEQTNEDRNREEIRLQRNTWDSARSNAKKEGFVGIGTFEQRMTGQYAVSDKELRQEKNLIRRENVKATAQRGYSYFTSGLNLNQKHKPRNPGRIGNAFKGRVL